MIYYFSDFKIYIFQIQVQSQPTPDTATAAAPAAAAYRKPGTMTKREVKQAMVRNDPDRPERNEQDKPAGAQATLFDFLQGKVVPNSGTGDNDSEEPERYETGTNNNASICRMLKFLLNSL